MVQILLVLDDPLIRDQILVGTKHVRGVKVDSVEETSALEWIRQGAADCVFLQFDHQKDPTYDRIREFQELGPEVELVVVTDSRSAKHLQKDRGERGAEAVLTTPITADSFFRLLGRLAPRMKRKKQRMTA